MEWALSFIDSSNASRVPDVGCGDGGAIRRMLKAYPGLHVDGLDYSPDCIDLSRRVNREELGRRCAISLGSVDAMPYSDKSYDLATAIETICFWPDVPQALREIRRVLRPGGRLMVCCELGSVEQAGKYAERISTSLARRI